MYRLILFTLLFYFNCVIASTISDIAEQSKPPINITTHVFGNRMQIAGLVDSIDKLNELKSLAIKYRDSNYSIYFNVYVKSTEGSNASNAMFEGNILSVVENLGVLPNEIGIITSGNEVILSGFIDSEIDTNVIANKVQDIEGVMVVHNFLHRK